MTGKGCELKPLNHKNPLIILHAESCILDLQVSCIALFIQEGPIKMQLNKT